MPMRLPFSRGSSSDSTPSSPVRGLNDQRVGRPVVGIGVLDQFVALRIAHDDVALVGAERVAHEAGHLREIRVGHASSAELGASNSASLFSMPFSGLVGERHVVGVGADAQHVRVDQFDGGAEFPSTAPRAVAAPPRSATASARTAESSRHRPALNPCTPLPPPAPPRACPPLRGRPRGTASCGARAQIDVNVIDVAHDVLVWPKARHHLVLAAFVPPL